MPCELFTCKGAIVKIIYFHSDEIENDSFFDGCSKIFFLNMMPRNDVLAVDEYGKYLS